MVQEEPEMAERAEPHDRKGHKSGNRGSLPQGPEVHVGNLPAGQAEEERFPRLGFNHLYLTVLNKSRTAFSYFHVFVSGLFQVFHNFCIWLGVFLISEMRQRYKTNKIKSLE